MVFTSFYIFFHTENYKILKLITYSPEIILFFKINKGVRQYNTTSLLVFSGALINTSNYLEVVF